MLPVVQVFPRRGPGGWSGGQHGPTDLPRECRSWTLSNRFPSAALMDSGVRLLREARIGPARLPATGCPYPARRHVRQAVTLPNLAMMRSASRFIWPGIHATTRHSRGLCRPLEAVRPSLHVRRRTCDRDASCPHARPWLPGRRRLVECSLGRRPDFALLSDFSSQDYYPATLHVLSLMAIAESIPHV